MSILPTLDHEIEKELAETCPCIFREVVMKGRGAITIADSYKPDCPLVYCNQAFLDLTGYKKSEVLGKNCRFLQGEDSDQSAIEQLRYGIENHETIHVTIKNYRKDKSYFWNSLTISPLSIDGEVRYFVGIQLDVTDQYDQMLRRLEQMELAAHEIKNPLTIINLYLEMIKENDEYSLAVSQMEEQIQKINSRIDLYLAHDPHTAGTFHMTRRPVHISKFLKDILQDYIQSDQLALIDESNGGDTVLADTKLLATAVKNLITNAYEYSAEGSTVTVIVKAVDRQVQIVVHNTGSHISDKMQARLFKQDFNRDNASEGRGLGLFITRNIVSQHGGIIEVESSEDKGTSFIIKLPFQERLQK